MRLKMLLLLLPVVLGAWEPYLEFEGRAGDFRKGGGAVLWAPVAGNGQSVLFGQAGAGRFIDLWAGNVGGGYRRLCGPQLGAGVNAFFDVARSELDRTYLQGGVGVELFGPCWVARANGYIPSPNRFRSVRTEARLDTISLGIEEIVDLTDTTVEAALFGADAEVGYGMCLCGNEAWLFAGLYGYNGPSFDGFVGPRVRAEYRFRDALGWCGAQVVVAGEYQWDDLHRSQGSAILTVRVPFGKKRGRRPCLNICDRMRDPVRRQPAMWALNKRTVREVRSSARPGGGPIWFVAQDATGVGTQLDPASINTPFVNAQPGDAIILIVQQLGMDRVSMDNAGPTAAPYPLLEGSSMAAFGAFQQITVIVQGRPVKVTKIGNQTEGMILTTTNPTGNDLIRADGKNQIFNFNTENGERAIVGPAANDILVRGMNIVTPNAPAIEMTNANNVMLEIITLSMPQDRGVVLNGATNVSVNFLAADGPLNTVLDITGGNGVRASTIATTALPANIDAVRFSGTSFTLSGINNNIIGPGAGTGVGFNFTNASNVSLNGTAANPITAVGFGTGVAVNGGSNISMTHTNVSNSVADGVSLNNVTGNVKYTSSTINMSGANALNITNSAATMDIALVNVNTAAQGYRFAGTTGSISLNNAMIQNIMNQGVVADSLTGGSLLMNSLNLDMVGTGVEVIKTDGTSASVIFDNSTITNAQYGLLMSVTGARTLNTSVNNSKIVNVTGGGQGCSFFCEGTGAVMNNTFNAVSLTNVTGQGMLLGSNGPANGFTQRVTVDKCMFGGATPALGIGGEAIAVSANGSGGTSNCDVAVTGCTFDNVNPGGGGASQAISLRVDGPAGAGVNLTANISDCGFTAVGSRGIVGTWIGSAQANQALNVTASKNTWTPTDPSLPFLELVDNGPGGLGVICADINGNSTGTTNPSISLGSTAAGAGTMNVVAPGLPLGPSTATQVAANVQGRNTVVAGSVQTFAQTPYVVVQSCPQPTPPSE
jgi:Inverse autotransporter, beta-domain